MLECRGSQIKISCLFDMQVPYPVRAQSRHHDKARKPVVCDLLLPKNCQQGMLMSISQCVILEISDTLSQC